LSWKSPPGPRSNTSRIDYQDSYYYAAPKTKDGPKSLDEVDPEMLAVYAKLGIPLKEQEVLAGVEGAPRYAVDAVFDSVSVVTTFKKELAKVGVIFCSMSEAIREHPDLVRQYLGSVVPVSDNYFACLNSAVFSDGSFVYIPPGVRCPMELSTYFRINAKDSGPVRAHPDHRRQGRYVVPRGLHGPDARREPAARGGRRDLVPGRRRDQIFHRPELVPRRSQPARAASTTSSPSAPTAGATAPRSAGPRWRPARP
jgi:hypothetical protein